MRKAVLNVLLLKTLDLKREVKKKKYVDCFIIFNCCSSYLLSNFVFTSRNLKLNFINKYSCLVDFENLNAVVHDW